MSVDRQHGDKLISGYGLHTFVLADPISFIIPLLSRIS